MEQQTIEEAAYRARRDYQDEVGKDGMNECIMFDAMKIQRGFELGAKWQQDRMYSEEEVFNLCREFAIFVQRKRPSYKKQQEWFEQFKK